MAGSLKRANPTLIEDGVLIRAMRDANVPKFLKDDLPLFGAIIQDLFPGVEITENDYGKFKETVEIKIDDAELQRNPVFVTKVIQLYETFNVRFGVMLVGPTGSGKSRCYEVLRETMIHLREQNDPNQTF
jgi:dynein heavy chain